MQTRSHVRAAAMAWLCLSPVVGRPASAQTQSSVPPNRQAEALVTTHAAGTFDVTLAPLSTADSTEGLGRMSIAKQFHGDLEGTSRGEMLTAMTRESGSAGYVAVERVSGTLRGRRGTFVLQHSGTMERGGQHLRITVVPDSGTDQLAGLAGTMTITLAGGVHSYEFEYTVGSAH